MTKDVLRRCEKYAGRKDERERGRGKQRKHETKEMVKPNTQQC